jgi:tRNA-specific 2-thiouridylase
VRPGAIVDSTTGEQLAEHGGVHGFTVGQRKGLGVAAPAADGRPRYVTAIEPATGTVRVGPATALDVRSIDGVAPVWAAGAAPGESFECIVQVRAHGGLAPAVVHVTADGVAIELTEPLRGVAPGQTAAFYRDDVVLGSARIAATGA